LPNRLLSFRAALLLLISSAVIIWPISYWLPIGDFLSVLNSSGYSNYAIALKGIVVVYFLFFMMNLISAGLAFTKLDGRVKFALVLIPSSLLILLPMILVIPVAQGLSDRGYFTVLQAIFRLLRFSTPQLWIIVVIVTLLSLAINVLAAILLFKDKTGQVEKAIDAPGNLKKRYGIYSAVLACALVIVGVSGLLNSDKRSLDRQSCSNYAALPIPETDQEVPTFLSDVQLYGDAAGTQEVKDALVSFAQYSRQYYLLLDSENPGIDMDQLVQAITISRDKVIEVCSEYSVG